MCKQAVLQCPLAIHPFKTCELQEVGALENQVGREHIVVPQGRKLFLDEFVGLTANGCTLKKHPVNLLAKMVAAPSFGCSHSDIKHSLKVIFKG